MLMGHETANQIRDLKRTLIQVTGLAVFDDFPPDPPDTGVREPRVDPPDPGALGVAETPA
jgi:hypothetical protein